ncbi:MAG: phosphoribosylamine--glycine ligase [Pyrinomonadaceae bacterium]
MNILVIGSGGREHAICAAFARSSRVTKIFCAPGNAGIAEIAECVAIRADDNAGLVTYASENAIDLTFVGGETSLALGIVDEFESRGLKIIGPNKEAAQLEASKSFAKDFMARHGVPTAKYVTAHSPAFAVLELESGDFGDENTPVVVKADGLAAGKGVVVAANRVEAIAAINEMAALVGADAAEKIVLEECLVGKEVSLLMFVDGENIALMPPTRDYKRIGEGDTGPNTGGMGTITDASLLTVDQTNEIIDKMIKPTLDGCIREGFPFRGILFLGIMMAECRSPHVSKGVTPDVASNALANEQVSAPMLLEYNVRFGDPETQSILVRLETDFVDICEAMLSENRVSSPTVREGSSLAELDIKWKTGNSATIVLASKGYPEKPQTGDGIHGLATAQLREDVSIFHAGTSLNSDGKLVTSGGRVLGVTAMADSLQEALDKAYEAVYDISWDGMQYRRDIGS